VLLLGGGAYGFHWVVTSRYIEATDDAYVKSDSIVISPKVSGYVAEVLVKDNQWVKAGQALARIEPSEYQSKVDQQDAAQQSGQAALGTIKREQQLQRFLISQSSAAVGAANSQLAKNKVDLQREQKLLSQGFTTQEQIETVKLALDLATANAARVSAEFAAAQQKLAVLQGRELQLQAELKRNLAESKSVQLDLAHTILTAPISGFVGNKSVEVGRYVRAGTQLMFVVPLDQVYVTANFKETQIKALRHGQRVHVVVDAFPGEELMGSVDSISPATGSEFSLFPPENAVGNFTKIVQRVSVKIALDKAGHLVKLLRPGMSVGVTVNTN
jgi:membrane fusion protein (multidrug efflux system)